MRPKEKGVCTHTGVLFLETLAKSKPQLYVELVSDNSVRVESVAEASDLDTRTRAVWSAHPRFRCIEGERSAAEQSEATIQFCRELLA